MKGLPQNRVPDTQGQAARWRTLKTAGESQLHEDKRYLQRTRDKEPWNKSQVIVEGMRSRQKAKGGQYLSHEGMSEGANKLSEYVHILAVLNNFL